MYSQNSIFSLFHHDLSTSSNIANYNAQRLLNLSISQEDFYAIADTINKIVLVGVKSGSNKNISLTLTGGMDSRLILACLLKLGIKPNCSTYGNPYASDVIYAQTLCKSLGLNFQNVCQKPPTKEIVTFPLQLLEVWTVGLFYHAY